MFSKNLYPLVLGLAFITLSACSTVETEAKYPTGYDRTMTGNDIYGEKQSILGPNGLKILGGKGNESDGGSGIGVNGFLWRASLDTVSFMPLASADPFGGVILTDWYRPDEAKDERYKVNVFIMGRELRSDGVRVRVFKQVSSRGTWTDVQATDSTARELEDAILTRARQMRVAQLGNE